jgi:hypothetical protein
VRGREGVPLKALKVIMGLLGIFVTMPITLYLQYKILTLVYATDVMWFLFWVNIPVLILLQIISKVAENVRD